MQLTPRLPQPALTLHESIKTNSQASRRRKPANALFTTGIL